MSAEFRIEYTIQRKTAADEDFVDVGFGSSGAWGTLAAAEHILGSYIQNRQWETEPGMPDPDALEER